MRNIWRNLILVFLIIPLLPAVAELQNVEVGGTLRIRGNYFDYDDLAGAKIEGNAFVEQRTRLNVKADFTDNVSAFIEFDSYSGWGEDFRSNYLTGSDLRGSGDAALYQAYIDVHNLWGTPLHARIGRQELKLGSGWLIGANDSAPYFSGQSFDALLLSYVTDAFSIHAVTAKLAEGFNSDRDDVDVYGIYNSYTGIENVALDAYWLYIRDDAHFDGGLNAHVFGLRGAGTLGVFDFETEAVYQYLNWDKEAPVRPDGETSSNAFGANLLLGYTFDTVYRPRIQVGAAYFSGDDGDLAFNRLFSDWKYSLILDTDRNLSNHWLVHTGISAKVTEAVTLSAYLGYFAAVQNREISRFLWWSERSDKPLGVEAGVKAQYNYTEDLCVVVGYSRLFALEGLRDGNYVPNNGAALAQIDDINYVYAETQLKF